MSNKSIVRYLVVLLFAVFTSAVIVVADLGALAQNANSSTTQDDSMQNTNATPTRRGRRGRRRPAAAPAADASMPADAGMAADTGTQSPGEQTDLSGTYIGHVKMWGGHEMETDGTLTITGNQFTLDGGGMTHSGRVYAVTTRGYTGASFYFSDVTDSATNTPVVAMGRARKSGDHLSITRIPGARTSITFGSGGVGGGSHRPRRGRRRAAPAATETPAPSDNTNTTPPM